MGVSLDSLQQQHKKKGRTPFLLFQVRVRQFLVITNTNHVKGDDYQIFEITKHN